MACWVKQRPNRCFQSNGVAPTDETITDGSYMIQRPLLIVGKGNMGGVADAFTKYL